MAAWDETPILELGTKPIAGDNPCGEDAADHENYIFVDGEMSKLGRIEVEEPDWRGIERSATELLSNTSKDVEISSALGFALFKSHRYEGLAAWLGLTLGLVQNFWDGLYPARPRRRKARIETFTDTMEGGWFRENPASSEEDFDALDKCAERIAALDAAITERMPDDPPEFGKFIRRLKEECGKRPAKAAPAPPAERSADTSVTAAPGAPASGEVTVAEPTDRGSASSAALQAASFLRKADPSDPLAYALVRSVKWARIELPSSDAGKYQIDPPESSQIDTLQHQHGKQLWENLLKNAEAAFRTADPLWLDLQFYVVSAMRGLGPSYEKAAETVIGAIAALLRRLGDGLFELTFKGGTPLCGGEARMWIDSEVKTQGEGSGGGGSSAMNGRLSEASEKARKLVSSGKLKEALAEFQEGMAGCSQRRDRFLWRYHTAKLCFDAQRLQLAAPLLEECFEEVRRYKIEEWEPSLASGVAQTLYRCRKLLVAAEKSPTPEALDKVRESFAWLCQLDPVAALAAEPSGK